VPPRTDVELAAVVLRTVDDLCDLAVVVVEDFAQQEHRALDRRQAFEQNEKCHRKRVGGLRVCGGVGPGLGDERVGQPLADVLLAAHARRPQVVDAEPRHDGRQVRLRGVDLHAVGLRLVDAQECLLHDVLGLTDAADHPVGDREQQRSQVFVGRFRPHVL
jgi:hypothetical protein